MPPVSNFQKSCFAVAVANALASMPTQAATLTIGGNCDTLINAIQSANTDTAVMDGGMEVCAAGSGPDLIELPQDPLTYNSGSAYLADYTALPAVTSVIAIQGHANGSTVERAGAEAPFRIFTVGVSGDLRLNGVTVQGGLANSSGGGIYVYYGSLTLDATTVTANSAVLSGGGIATKQASLTLLNSSTVSTNVAAVAGGIETYNTALSINDSLVTANTATTGIGGGLSVYNEDPGGPPTYTTTITNSQLTNNRAAGAAGYGGGAYLRYLSADIQNSIFSGNYASQGGGGIYVKGYDSELTLNGSTLTSNSVNTSNALGGALCLGDVATIITDTTISQNLANQGGGIAIDNYDANLLLTNTRLLGNSAQRSGGAITNRGGGTITLTGSTVDANVAINNSGGGVYDIAGSLIINKSTFSSNLAGESGGGINHNGQLVRINVSTFSGNSAGLGGDEGLGAAVRLNSPALNYIYNSTFYENVVVNDSDASTIYADVAPTIVNTVVASSTNTDCNFEGSLAANNNNWFSDASCSGTAMGQPRLNPLQDNNAGLPGQTLTHAPALSSGLLAGGDPNFCDASLNPMFDTDQRGAPRVDCDIGAVEGGVAGEFDDAGCFVVRTAQGNVLTFCL